MPIRFETEWVPTEDVRGPELASTWASLLVRVDDSVITRVVDRRAQTVRDHVYVPLYPLAESLVTNWWFLLHEVGNPAKDDDDAFMRRHALVSLRDGSAFPRLQVASSGGRTLLAWESDSPSWAKLDYQGENRIWIDRNEFREGCTELVDRVVRRLLSCGIERTLLQEEWAAIQAADQDESRFCRTAAGLGWIRTLWTTHSETPSSGSKTFSTPRLSRKRFLFSMSGNCLRRRPPSRWFWNPPAAPGCLCGTFATPALNR